MTHKIFYFELTAGVILGLIAVFVNKFFVSGSDAQLAVYIILFSVYWVVASHFFGWAMVSESTKFTKVTFYRLLVLGLSYLLIIGLFQSFEYF